MRQPLRVLLVSPFPPPSGGIGRWAVQIKAAGDARPDEVIFRCLDISPRWRAVYDLTPWKRVLGGGLQMLRDVLRFLGMLRRRPDVVHLNSHGQLAPFRDIPILAACRLLGIPTVYHMRFGRIPEISRKRTAEWRRLRIALRLARTVVAIDAATFDTLRVAFPAKRLSLLPNVVSMPSKSLTGKPDPARPYLVFLGHVIPTKGIEELLEAWRELEVGPWRLLIVGTIAATYRQDLQQRRLTPSVEFLGEFNHDRAMECLAAADGLVLPSYTEGFPNVVAEAMAMGKPVVATSVGAIPDMLSHGCGLVVPPRDSGALRAALERLMADPELRRNLGAHGRAKAAAQYSVGAVFERLLAIWRDGRQEETA